MMLALELVEATVVIPVACKCFFLLSTGVNDAARPLRQPCLIMLTLCTAATKLVTLLASVPTSPLEAA